MRAFGKKDEADGAMNNFKLLYWIIAIGLSLVVGFTALVWSQSTGDRPRVNTAMHGAAAGAPAPDPASIVEPDTLSARGAYGRILFSNVCASCHGSKGAGGTGKAPPLIHPIYEPGHHPDEAFQRAASQGVRSHHWNFGDMPPIEGVSEGEVALIATYIREVQRANGIE